MASSDLPPSQATRQDSTLIRAVTRKLSRKSRRTTGKSQKGWEEHGREPYHEYIHQLVDAGWDNLKKLDEYLSQNRKEKRERDLTISVLDVLDDFQQKRHEDIGDELALKTFLSEASRDAVKVRLFMVEQLGSLSSGVMEAFGSALKLDPRFFQWSLYGHKNLLSPAERHRVPFTSIGFTVLSDSTAPRTDTDFFRVSVYIKNDEARDHWTGELNKVNEG
jgi:hypothetical protein